MLLVSQEGKKRCAPGCRRQTCSVDPQPAEWPPQTVAEGVGDVWRYTSHFLPLRPKDSHTQSPSCTAC